MKRPHRHHYVVIKENLTGQLGNMVMIRCVHCAHVSRVYLKEWARIALAQRRADRKAARHA